MKYILTLVSYVFCCCTSIYALVHYIKLEKGANGCKTPGENSVDFDVGAYAQDENVCGAYTCHSLEGDALIHYCQRPVTFAECNETGVATNVDFPQCCWMCVLYTECSSSSSSSVDSSPDSSNNDDSPEPDARTKGGSNPMYAKSKGSKIKVTDADDSEDIKHDGEAEYAKLVDSNENIRFGGGTPITKFGESSK
ncbi:hypothetical protein KR067_006926, partial [Drosophila pandora]